MYEPRQAAVRVGHRFDLSRWDCLLTLAFFAGAASSEVGRPVGCIFATMCGTAGAGRFLVFGGMLVVATPDRNGTLQRLMFNRRMQFIPDVLTSVPLLPWNGFACADDDPKAQMVAI